MTTASSSTSASSFFASPAVTQSAVYLSPLQKLQKCFAIAGGFLEQCIVYPDMKFIDLLRAEQKAVEKWVQSSEENAAKTIRLFDEKETAVEFLCYKSVLFSEAKYITAVYNTASSSRSGAQFISMCFEQKNLTSSLHFSKVFSDRLKSIMNDKDDKQRDDKVKSMLAIAASWSMIFTFLLNSIGNNVTPRSQTATLQKTWESKLMPLFSESQCTTHTQTVAKKTHTITITQMVVEKINNIMNIISPQLDKILNPTQATITSPTVIDDLKAMLIELEAIQDSFEASSSRLEIFKLHLDSSELTIGPQGKKLIEKILEILSSIGTNAHKTSGILLSKATLLSSPLQSPMLLPAPSTSTSSAVSTTSSGSYIAANKKVEEKSDSKRSILPSLGPGVMPLTQSSSSSFFSSSSSSVSSSSSSHTTASFSCSSSSSLTSSTASLHASIPIQST